jgi:hypothetical protein
MGDKIRKLIPSWSDMKGNAGWDLIKVLGLGAVAGIWQWMQNASKAAIGWTAILVIACAYFILILVSSIRSRKRMESPTNPTQPLRVYSTLSIDTGPELDPKTFDVLKCFGSFPSNVGVSVEAVADKCQMDDGFAVACVKSLHQHHFVKTSLIAEGREVTYSITSTGLDYIAHPPYDLSSEGEDPKLDPRAFHVLKWFNQINPYTGAGDVQIVANLCGLDQTDALACIMALQSFQFIEVAIIIQGEWKSHYKITDKGRDYVRHHVN